MRFSFLRQTVRRLQGISFPGFDNVPMNEVYSIIRKQLRRDTVQARAAAVAYHSLLAVFPAILFGMTILSFLPVESFHENVTQFVVYMLPLASQQFAYDTITRISNIHPTGYMLLVTVLTSLYFASNGIGSLLNAFWKAEPESSLRPSFFHYQLLYIGLTLVLLLNVVFTIICLLIGQFILNMVSDVVGNDQWLIQWLLQILKIVFALLFAFNSIAVTYFLARTKTHRWRFINPGATVATVMSILASIIFSQYVNYYSPYDQLYGSVSALVALMVWFYLIALALVLGYELNVALYHVKKNYEKLHFVPLVNPSVNEAAIQPKP